MNIYDEVGMQAEFYDSGAAEKHRHPELELIYVLEGKIALAVNEEVWRMQKEDLLVINSGCFHSWKGEGSFLLCAVTISRSLLARELGTDYVTFWCNSAADPDGDYTRLREIMRNLIAEYAMNMERLNFKKKSLLYELADCLLNLYLIESNLRKTASDKDRLLEHVLQYIQENYWRQLSLTEVSGQAYMNASTFSRYFKKNVGINFVEYLNNVRLSNALEDLLHSNKPITDIAVDHGFTNPSMFSKAFRAAYGMAPSEYKKSKKGDSEICKKGMNSDFVKELELFVAEWKEQIPEELFVRQISLNVEESRPYEKIWNKAVNVGAACELLSARMQQHVLMLKKNLGFSYVRFYSIFGWDMQIREDTETRKLNFELIDNVLDFIVANGMYPMIELGNKPKRVIQNISLALYQEEVRPVFSSLEDARWMIGSLMDHVIRRYGVNEVEHWRFENWNDVHQRSMDDSYEYLEIFDMVYETIKSRVPNAVVGGPGSPLGKENYTILREWRKWKHLPDFISVCAFPYRQVGAEFSLGPEGADRSTDMHFFMNELKKLWKCIQEAGLAHIPLEVTEWNMSLSDRNFYNDSCGKAAHMLMNMVEVQEYLHLGAYYGASDIIIRYYDSDRMFFGGSGLLNKDGLAKPAYYALYVMQKMGSRIIGSGDCYLVTTNGRSDYYVILFNSKKFNYNYFAKEEEQIQYADLTHIFSDTISMKVVLELNHIPDGAYSIKTYSMGGDNSSVLNRWWEMCEALDLEMKDIEYLRSVSMPRIKIRQKCVKGGMLQLTEILKPHDIRYIHIHR